MPIVIGAKRESDFTDPIGMLGDCHRRIEMFLNVLVRVSEQAQGETLNEEERGVLETALRYFREAAPKHTADEEESLFPRLRQIESPDVRALMVRIESLEEEHVCADTFAPFSRSRSSGWSRSSTNTFLICRCDPCVPVTYQPPQRCESGLRWSVTNPPA